MDRYQRLRKIGEGAFGKAVLVRHKQTNKQCVVKEINIVRMSPKEREDSRKEVAVLAQLKHPNIVTYLESFEEAGTLYIVMNYCAGGDLYARINSQRGALFQEEQILMWFVQICLAIKHIHDRKILHRDIKSQNIFLSSTGAVQLGDFGIAKVLNNTVELARTCIGTPYYLSPEIVENKPYNNKSDIWSLGCVLYELTTLKHAFEAGNMKNLVLKIIRGSYPPISPQYSYDLRGLIAQLFKRAPRDRPSINNILKKNFIMERVRRVLSVEQIADEFSHTIMHGAKIAKALPPAPRPSSAPKKSVTPRPGSAGGQRKYNVAAVYGAPVGRKSQNRSSSEQKKKGPPSGNRPVPVPGQQEWEQKKKNLVFKEQVRREDIKKQQEDQVARRHKDLVEKQKMDRMNKAKEEGWKSLVDSLDSDKEEKQPSPRGEARPLPMPRLQPAGPAQPNYLENRQAREPGNYNDYLAYLDKLKNERQQRERELDQRAGEYVPAPRPVPMLNRPGGGNNNQGPAALAVQQANHDRQMGAQAAERAKIVEDYVQRRREAAMNKARGQAELYGGRPPSAGPRASPVPRGRVPVAQVRNKEEQDYLENLRQIREQNMKERRALQQHKADAAGDKAHQKEAEERKKKVEALKQQAEDWAKKKKEQLEKDLQDLLHGNQGRPPSADGSRPNSAAAKVNMKPAVALPITGVLHVIGAGNKAAPPAAEGQVTPAPEERPQSAVQQKKSDILKRLNEKSPARGKWGADKQEAAQNGEGRSKWGEKAASPLAVTQTETPEPDSSRSQWDKDEKLRLSDLPLEQTASQMEATSARDTVVRNPSDVGENPRLARNQWGRPGSTIVKALNQLPVCEGTVTLDSGSGQEGMESPVTTTSIPPAIGFTITLSKSPAPAPVLTSTPTPVPIPSIKPPIRSGTIVIDKPTTTAATTASPPAASPPAASPPTAAATTTAEAATAIASTDKAPEVMASSSADGKAFDKCGASAASKQEKEDKPKEEEEDRSRSVQKGLCTGNFDMQNVQMLRTCSEPDLTRLFRSAVKCVQATLRRHQSLELDKSDNADDDITIREEALSPSDDREEGDDENGDGDGEDNGDDDEDLISMRETMQSLLIDDDDDDDGVTSPKVKFSLSADVDATIKKANESGKSRENGTDDDAVDKEDSADKKDGEGGAGQAKVKSHVVKSKSAPVLEMRDDDDNDENAEEEEKLDYDEAELLKLLDSDEETVFGDDDDDDLNLFSRLEQQREDLEKELGFDKFIEVYKTVQALQEDEDENMEEGARIAIQMLGEQKQHLYPRIFQLVMADTAFTEDNA